MTHQSVAFPLYCWKASSVGSGTWGLKTYITKSLDNHSPEYFIRRLLSQNQVKASLKYCVRPRPKRRNIIPLKSTQHTLPAYLSTCVATRLDSGGLKTAST